MLAHFYLRFTTKYGQTLFVSGNTPELGNGDISSAVPLTYLNENFWEWKGNLTTNNISNLQYKFILKEDGKQDIIEFGEDRILELNSKKSIEFITVDTWQNTADYRNNFYSQAFQQVLFVNQGTKSKEIKSRKSFSHELRVKAPILMPHEQICVLGSISSLGNWQTTSPLLMVRKGNWWSIQIEIEKSTTPITYKYGIYNNKTKQFIQYERGDDRILFGEANPKKRFYLHDGYANINNTGWKGAGVAIPVFSLRSKKSFGVGEFTDIKILVNWAKQCGLKLIQLLPINDTIATHTWADSYPYAAISAFALHPIYLNLEQIADIDCRSVIKPLLKKQKQLNALAVVDYEQVLKFKLSALKELYQLQKDTLREDIHYFNFFELNRHWLVPYAAFCYLRDKYKTSDFNTWNSNSVFRENNIQRLVSPSQQHYDEIAFHYFTQYHLHVQLKEATAYAHKNGVVVKGDLPIGIYRNSVDAWMEPELFNMDEQAGAPPDDFAVKGQNWGFPTYNWKRMQEDNFAWWRKRFEQMSNYFDAFRIDHILGFFRIWSIPINAVEGILGRFKPAIAISLNEFAEKGIPFSYERFCNPFISDAVLDENFGDKKDLVKQRFLNGYQLKEEYNTQRKVEKYFETNKIEDQDLKIGLYNLISNVILFEEEGSDKQRFHFRISMQQNTSFKNLDHSIRIKLEDLYINYFYRRQDAFWQKEAMQKLPYLKRSTQMLVCGEDLGMVPHCVPDVMRDLSILSLEIQRMPKKEGSEFFHPQDAPYLSVVTPSTHDMSTIRAWWEEDKAKTQRFYNQILGYSGEAPLYCETSLNSAILNQHLYSPAMWSIFQWQDIMGSNEKLRRTNPAEERINIPANPNHYWRYRMHIYLEDLVKEKLFNSQVKQLVTNAGR